MRLAALCVNVWLIGSKVEKPFALYGVELAETGSLRVHTVTCLHLVKLRVLSGAMKLAFYFPTCKLRRQTSNLAHKSLLT